MELFIKVVFWLYLVGVACRFILLSISDYPRTNKIKASMDVSNAIVGLCFAMWAWLLVWG